VFNRAYADFAEHYHTHIDPCRSASPKDKAYASYCTSSGVIESDLSGCFRHGCL